MYSGACAPHVLTQNPTMPIKFNRLTYYHVPKTGGTFAVRWLQGFAPQIGNSHWCRRQLLVEHPEVKDTLSLVVLRHPCEWLRSMWRFCADQRAVAGHTQWGYVDPPELAFTRECGAPTLEGYVENYLSRFPGAIWKAFLAYEPDVVVKQENLYQGLKEVFLEYEDLDIGEPPFDRLNMSVIRASIPEHLYGRVEAAEPELMNWYG